MNFCDDWNFQLLLLFCFVLFFSYSESISAWRFFMWSLSALVISSSSANLVYIWFFFLFKSFKIKFNSATSISFFGIPLIHLLGGLLFQDHWLHPLSSSHYPFSLFQEQWLKLSPPPIFFFCKYPSKNSISWEFCILNIITSFTPLSHPSASFESSSRLSRTFKSSSKVSFNDVWNCLLLVWWVLRTISMIPTWNSVWSDASYKG